MHRNEREPIMLFGKAYMWTKNERGNLELVSLERLVEAGEAVVAMIEENRAKANS